jgi:hypothetical protein
VDLSSLVRALRASDALSAREWVADARRSGLQLRDLPRPEGLDDIDIAIAAGVVELLAERWGQTAPSWTRTVGAAPARVFLVRAAERFPRLRASCEAEGPEPLRRRGLLAPKDFLTVC